MNLNRFSSLSLGKINTVIGLTGVGITPNERPIHSTYQVRVAKGEAFNQVAMTSMLQTLGSLLASHRIQLRLALEATHQEIYWTISVLGTQHDVTANQLLSYIQPHFPTATLIPHKIQPTALPIQRRWAMYQFPPVDWHTIMTDGSFVKGESLTHIVKVLESLQAGETVRIEFYLFNFASVPEHELLEALFITPHEAGYNIQPRMPYNAIGMMYELGRISYQLYQLHTLHIPRYPEREHQAYIEKLTQFHFDVRLCMTFDTPHPHRLAVFESINTAIQFWTRTKPTFLQRLANQRDRAGLSLRSYEQWVLHHPLIQFALHRASDKEGREYPQLVETTRIRLTAEELALLWHLPHQGFALDKIRWSVLIPDELQIIHRDTTVVGDVEGQPIGIARLDRQYPIVITGTPGMGKSTMAEIIALFDISLNDSCVVMVDPQGGLIIRLLQSLTEEQLERVVLIDVGDTLYPPPLNFLRNISAVDDQETFETMMWIFRAIYGNRWDEQSMVRLEATTHHLLSLLLADPEATILDLVELLDNQVLRNNLIDKLGKQRSSRLTRQFWTRLDNSSRGVRSSFTASAIARISGVTRYIHTQRMMGHPLGLDYKKMIQDKKIVLVDASAPTVSSSKGMLGALIFSQFYLACRSLGANTRPETGEMRPPRCYLSVDDADLFLTSTFPEIFSKSRQFGLAPILITQALSYLEEGVEEGIRKSRGTSITFGTDDFHEAREAVSLLNEYEPEDILGLDKGEAILRTRYQGRKLAPVTFKTQVKQTNLRSMREVNRLRQDLKASMPLYTHDGEVKIGLWSAEQIDEWLDKREASDLYLKARQFVKQHHVSAVDTTIPDDDDPKGVF